MKSSSFIQSNNFEKSSKSVKKKKKNRGIITLGEPIKTRHKWILADYKFSKNEVKAYIIPSLSDLDALVLYQKTGDEKYIAHIFFRNLGYFLNAIANALSYYGEDFRYTDARDYVAEAYLCVLEAAKRFDLSLSNKLLSYLAGAIFLYLRKAIRDNECRFWRETFFVFESGETEEDSSVARQKSEESAEVVFCDAKWLLEEVFERFKDELAKVNIHSIDEMHKLYEKSKDLSQAHKKELARIRRRIRRYLQAKRRYFFEE